MRTTGMRRWAKATALFTVVGLAGLVPAAQAYHIRDIQRNAHDLDRQLSALVTELLRSSHHQGEFFTGATEMRLVMTASALGGQARSLHILADRRQPADVQLAFREMVNIAQDIDRQIQRAHAARRVQDLWFRARNTLVVLGRDIYGQPRWDPWSGHGTIFLPFPGGNSPWGGPPFGRGHDNWRDDH